MNAKALLVILVIAVLLLAAYLLYFGKDKDVEPVTDDDLVVDTDGDDDGEPVTATGSGVIATIDTTGAMVDGPYVITTQSSSTTDALVIAVPSMGINLCSARLAIVDISTLKVGDRIEVRGALDAGGNIVPCEMADHYLRVVSA